MGILGYRGWFIDCRTSGQRLLFGGEHRQ
jgi:hypothetical protein